MAMAEEGKELHLVTKIISIITMASKRFRIGARIRWCMPIVGSTNECLFAIIKTS